MDNKTKGKFIGLFLSGIIISVIVFYFIGIGEITTLIFKINLFYYFLACLCFIGTLVAWTYRWDSFIKTTKHRVSFRKLFSTLIVGLGINNLTPVAKLGGEPIRAYILKEKEKIPMREGFATILADLSMEFTISTCLIFLSFFLITYFFEIPFWLFSVLVASMILSVLGLGILFGIFSSERVFIKIINSVSNKVKKLKEVKEKTIKIFKKFQQTFKTSFKNKPATSKGILFSLIVKIFDVFRYFFIFLALGYEINLIYVVIGVGMLGLLMTIPATPGSLGILEGGLISIYTLLGVPPAVAGSAVLLERLLSFWFITLVGGSVGSYYGFEILASGEDFFS